MKALLKPKTDSRAYRFLRLPNELSCLLVSDPRLNKGAASLAVRVGSLQDPKDRQGLAHFLEHMLFMGSEKYPEENSYGAYLAAHSGHSNAYTSPYVTNFMFEVAGDCFENALDRFSRFFYQPLLAKGSVDRELQAVHSEHLKNLQSDYRRLYQLQCHLSPPDSEFNHFSTGNMQTLRHSDIYERLRQFHANHYSSNLMSLALCSSQSLTTLQSLAQQYFKSVPNLRKARPSLTRPSHLPGINLGTMVHVLPVRQAEQVHYQFILPSKAHLFQTHPLSTLSHLLGCESKGSLLPLLIEAGLAYELSAGYHDEQLLAFSSLDLRISLTPKGALEVDKVTKLVLQNIAFLRASGVPPSLLSQLQYISKIRFDYQPQSEPLDLVTRLSPRIGEVPDHLLLAEKRLFRDYDLAQINRCLEELVPERLNVYLLSKSNTHCTQQEPVYGTKYSLSSLPAYKLTSQPFSLPKLNPFLPKETEPILPLPPKTSPQCLSQGQLISVYFKQDHQFQSPMVVFNLKATTDHAFSLRDHACLPVLNGLLHNAVRDLRQQGSDAGASADCDLSDQGLHIRVKGFYDGSDRYLLALLREVLRFDPLRADNLFAEQVDKAKRSCSDFHSSPPYQQVRSRFRRSLLQLPDIEQIHHQLGLLTLADCKQLFQKLSSRLRCRLLVSGGIDESRAKKLAKEVEQALGGRVAAKPATKNPVSGQLRLSLTNRNKQEPNMSHLRSYQLGQLTPRTFVLGNLAQLLLHQPFFDGLRTKQQLGYIVSCFSGQLKNWGYLNFLVQSAAPRAGQVRLAIDRFCSQWKERVITDQEFQHAKNSLRTHLEEPDYSMEDEAGRLWTELSAVEHGKEVRFGRKELRQKALEQTKPEDLRQFIRQLLTDSKIEIEVTAEETKASL